MAHTRYEINFNAAMVERYKSLDIPIERVPPILQAYADGIKGFLISIFPGTISQKVNHDLAGTFCIWFLLEYNKYIRIIEVGANGVILSDFGYYRAVVMGHEVQPLRFDYADPRLFQQLETAIKNEFSTADSLSPG
jgi:hypothetical protein